MVELIYGTEVIQVVSFNLGHKAMEPIKEAVEALQDVVASAWDIMT